jgi:hypothetical protein
MMRDVVFHTVCCVVGITLAGSLFSVYTASLATPDVQIAVMTADGVHLRNVKVHYQANHKAFGFVEGPGGIPVPGSYVKSDEGHVYTNMQGSAVIKSYRFPRLVREPSFHIWVSSIKVVKGCATGYVVVDSQRLIDGQVDDQEDYACSVHAQGADAIRSLPASITCRTTQTWVDIHASIDAARKRCDG